MIQIAQPQVCYPDPKQDMLDLKSSMFRKISNAAKSILSVDITGKDLFESIGSLSAPAPPPAITKPSTILKFTDHHLINSPRLPPISLQPPSRFQSK